MMRNLCIVVLVFTLIAPLQASRMFNDSSVELECVHVEKQANGLKLSLNLDRTEQSSFDNTDENILQELDGGVPVYESMDYWPSTTKMFRLPPTGGADIIFTNIDYEIIEDENLFNQLKDNLEEWYGALPDENQWYPPQPVDLGEPAIFHDFRIANLTTHFFQINPESEQIRQINNVDLDIEYNESTDINSLSSNPVKLSSTFLPWYRQLLDWEELELDSYEIYRGKVQVVVQNSAALLNLLQPWIDWKKQKGWDIEFLTDDDIPSWTKSEIYNELRNRYEDSSPPFDFVVLVGDASGPFSVPPGIYNDNFGGHGDHRYACLAGNDNLLDVAVGRISVESNLDLVSYVNKVLAYEKEPYMEDTTWYTCGFVGANNDGSGTSPVYAGEYAKRAMLDAGYSQVTSAYFNDGQGDVNARMQETVNLGVGFYLHRGCGGSGLNHAEIFGLNNNRKLPVVIDITCNRGNWISDVSYSEAWMRAGSVNSFKGGIGAISTATTETNTRFNNCLAGGGVYSVFALKQPTLGEMLMGAKLNMWKNLHGYQSQVVDFNDWLNLMGDPTVWIWTDIPRELNVTAASVIELGNHCYNVEVFDETSPLRDAWVALYKSDADEEVIAKGITGPDGILQLSTNFNYTGEAILTVTAQNAHPFRQIVQISSAQNRLGFTDLDIIDDGTLETIGNGNGRIESGETIGLLINLKNFGQNTENNISISAASNNENVISISGNPTLGSLAPGSEIQLNTPILIEINQNAPDQLNIPVNLTFSGDNGTYQDTYGMEVYASNYIFIRSDTSPEFGPGEDGTVRIHLLNAGRTTGNQSDVILESNYEWLTVLNNQGSINEIIPEEVGSTSVFSIHAEPTAYGGHLASATLIISEDGGRIQEVPILIPVGRRNSDDPAGPDNYGYYAFENTDLNYLLKPEYNWIEINPDNLNPDFSGTYLDLPDRGNDQDHSIVVELPFEFSYYGSSFTEITVCSNGWIAMGDQHSIALPRNWTIPSPLGPANMLAPFWDDRNVPVNPEDGGIYYYASETDGIAVIEWDRVVDTFNSSPCTFEVILYRDSDTHPTPTGDNEFLFQYKSMLPTSGRYTCIPYYTIGIENATQTDGLLISYYNETYEGYSELSDQSCIFFTTRTSPESGNIYGQITHSDDNSPVEGVRVTASGMSSVDISDADGNYEISAYPGPNSLIFTRSGYDTFLIENVNVVAEENIEVNVTLQRPQFIVNPYELSVQLNPGESGYGEIVASNNSIGEISYTGQIIYENGSTGNEVGQILESYVPDQWSNRYHPNDLVYKDDFYWVIVADNDNNSLIMKTDLEGVIQDIYDLNVDNVRSIQLFNNQFVLVSPEIIRTYDYSESDGFQLADTLNHNVEFDMTVGAYYDPVGECIYLGSWFLIQKYDLNGQLLDEVTIDLNDLTLSVNDFQIVEDDPEGLNLHALITAVDQENLNLITGTFRVNLENDQIEMVFNEPSTGWYIARGMVIMEGVHSPNTEMATIAFKENPFLVKIDSRNYFTASNWASLTPASGTIHSGEEQTLIINIDGTNMREGSQFNITLSFDHSAGDEPIFVPLSVYAGTNEITQDDSEIPESWKIDSIWPNPFNPTTNIKFSLLAQADVKLRLYNVLGQQVQTIINRPMQAGVHTASIDGSQLASGIYFLQLQAGPLQDVRKIILMK